MLKWKVSRLLDVLKGQFTERTKQFLDNSQPSHGNLIQNTKKKQPQEPDAVGFARLDTGEVIRVEGYKKAPSKPGSPKSLSLRVYQVPRSMYNEDEDSQSNFF